MYFIGHALTTYVIADALGCPPLASALMAMDSVEVDARGVEEMAKGDYDHLYATQHAWHWSMFLRPGKLLHLLIDSFWHKKTGGWYPWGRYVEPVIDVVCLVYLYFRFFA